MPVKTNNSILGTPAPVQRNAIQCNKMQGERLITSRQERTILALLSEKSVEAVAARMQINPCTIYRWLNQKDFQDAYRAACRESVARTLAQLQQTCQAAVNTLDEIMKNQENPASTRVSAGCILELGIQALHLEDLESRVAALESDGGPR